MVVIMRGISGGGKSTFSRFLQRVSVFPGESGIEAGELARRLLDLAGWPDEREVLSADSYFCDSSGVYRYDPEKVGEAHRECLRDFVRLVTTEYHRLVIVDNTNTTVGEYAPYARVASAFGHDVHFVEIQCDPAVACERNVHGVPRDKVWKQAQNISRSQYFIEGHKYGALHLLRTS